MQDNITDIRTSALAATSNEKIGLEVDRASGVYIYDKSGKRYIDFISGIAVNNLGHNHPAIVTAVKKQASSYMHTMVYGEYEQESQIELANLITNNLPDPLDKVFFTNSGSEAVEGALKLAKKFTGKQEIIAFDKAYHGSSHGALSVTGDEDIKEGYGPLLPNIKHLQFNELQFLGHINKDTAAVIIEPIQGEAGTRPANIAYMTTLQYRCHETSTLLILDESQTGFGRMGTLFAMEYFSIIPDILILAKAIGGGMPLGAFIAKETMMEVLSHDPALAIAS